MNDTYPAGLDKIYEAARLMGLDQQTIDAAIDALLKPQRDQEREEYLKRLAELADHLDAL